MSVTAKAELGKMVSTRYYKNMPSEHALHLLERLFALLRSELRTAASEQGLEPVHAVTLWYLARANVFSNNPLAVGDFLGLSKGNVSQQLILLEGKGLLTKTPDTADRRRLHLTLTPAGKAMLARLYPPKSWSSGESPDLERVLDAALRGVIAANGGKSFGICHTCRFHQRRVSGGFCQLLQIPLSAKQAGQICQEHQVTQLDAS